MADEKVKAGKDKDNGAKRAYRKRGTIETVSSFVFTVNGSEREHILVLAKAFGLTSATQAAKTALKLAADQIREAAKKKEGATA